MRKAAEGAQVAGVSRGRGSRIALVVLVALAIAHAVVVASVLMQPLDVRRSAPERRAVGFELYNDAVHRIGPAADFFAVYRAGVQVRAGRSPYSGAPDPGNPPYGFAYRYPPIVAQTLGRALAALPPRAAWIAWGFANEILLLGFLSLWWSAVPARGMRGAGIGLLLASTPYFLELHMGQFTFAAAVLACAALLLLERSTGIAARATGVLLLGAGAALKLFPLAALPALRRDRLACVGACLAAAGLVGAIAWHGLASPEDLDLFTGVNIAGLSPGPQRGNFGMLYTLTAAAREAGVAWTPSLFVPIARAWQILLLGSAALLAWRAPHRALALAGASMLTAFFLAYQDVWEHHYSGVLVAGLLVARGVLAQAAAPAERALVWLALVAIALPTPFAWLDARGDLTWRSWPGFHQWAVPLAKSGPLFVLHTIGITALLRAARGGAGCEPEPLRRAGRSAAR